jgi:hypothetical protein
MKEEPRRLIVDRLWPRLRRDRLLREQASHVPTIVSSPATAPDNLSSSSAASGRMCSSRFVRARIRITEIRNFFRSCCAASVRSTVINTSNSFSASSSNSPFLIPLQPRFGTVVTAWPTSERANRRSTHSSRMQFHFSTAASTRSFASSRKAMTCSRETVGKPSRKSSIESPPSR